jgi:hypothetical protein
MKNGNIKEIMGVKGKPDIIDLIQRKRLQCYGHVKRMPEDRIPKLIMEWLPEESGPGSSVGMATDYGLDGPGIERPDRPWVHPASCTMGTGSFLGVKRPGRGADHPPLLAPSGPLVACYRVNFTFYFTRGEKKKRKS